MATAVSIPLSRAREVLIVQPHEITEDIISILKREQVDDLNIWMACARALLAQGKLQAYKDLLKELIREIQYRREKRPETKFIHVQAICSLAELCYQQARLSEHPDEKRPLTNEAQAYYFEAQKVDNQEMLPHLGLGEAALYIGDIETAKKEFKAAQKNKCNGRPSIAGTLALARLTFSQGQYSEALAMYRNALRTFPGCPAEVRLGIAACQLRLGEVVKAEQAYRRVLELDPSCTQALLGLAVMELAVGASAEATQHGSRLLAQAFREDPHNPYTLALLAHFSLQQGLADTALRLAQAAMERADKDDRALLAEVTVLLGRAHHAKGSLGDALEAYREALKLEPHHPTARLGKAQLDLAIRGDQRGVTESLESLLEQKPAWTDALRILAPLCPRVYQGAASAKSARHFKEAAERESTDASLYEMLGDVLAGSDPAGALNAYSKAISLHRAAAATSNGDANGTAAAPVPARLLNNAAVLQLRSGNAAAAQSLLVEAINSAQAGGLSQLHPLAQVTLGYNSARICEANGDLMKAETEYKAMLDQFPEYSDCYLRLACISKERGDIRAAEDWAQRAAEASGRSADALALLAGLHLMRMDIPMAKRYLEELQQSVTQLKHEIYARVALGNVHLYSIKDTHIEANRPRSENQLTHAAQLYRRVLEKDPGNIFAANGIGCVLAECGRLNEAKEMFLKVQEEAAGSDGFFRVPDAWVNLAGVYAAMHEFRAAEQTYLTAIRRFPEVRDNARVQLYLAKVQYDGGNGEAALRTLCRTVHLAPRDLRIRFNLSYVLQQLGSKTLMKNDWPVGDTSKVRKLEQALARLRAAREGFIALHAAGREATGISQRELETHIKHIEDLLKTGEKIVVTAKKDAAAAANRLELNKLKLEQEASKRRLEERRKELEVESQKRAEEARAQEAAAKLERLKSEWRQGDVLAKAAAAGDASTVAKGREQQQKNANQPDALDAMFAEESEDEEYVPGQDDSGDAGGAAAGGEGGEEMGTAALLSAGLLSDEDEDEDEDFDLPNEEELEAEEKEGKAKGEKKKKKEKKKSKEKKEKSGGGGGRLKKRSREAATAPTVEGEGGEQGDDDAAAKRARQAAVLEDSDAEEGGEAAAGEQKATMADLFGSDSE